jgi:hypothetical protein
VRRIESEATYRCEGGTRLMKSVNRKVLMTLIGVVLVAPFLAIASVVGVHAAALADNVRVDMFCVGLALASVAVRILDQHLALKTEGTVEGYFSSNGHTGLRKSSVISPRY